MADQNGHDGDSQPGHNGGSQPGHDGGSQRGNGSGSPDFQRAFTREARLSEEGVHPRMRLSQVHFRLGSRFFSVWWLLPWGVLGGVVVVAAFKVFYTTSAAQSFIKTHPCSRRRASRRGSRSGS